MAAATTVVIPAPARRSGQHSVSTLPLIRPGSKPRCARRSPRPARDFDLGAAEAVLARWHALATMAANPLTPAENDQLTRARAGDLRGLRTRDEYGNWVTL